MLEKSGLPCQDDCQGKLIDTANGSFEVKQLEDAGCVREHHQQVHLSAEQGLSPEDDDELNESEDPEEEASEDDPLRCVLILDVTLLIASWDGRPHVISACLKDNRHGNHL